MRNLYKGVFPGGERYFKTLNLAHPKYYSHCSEFCCQYVIVAIEFCDVTRESVHMFILQVKDKCSGKCNLILIVLKIDKTQFVTCKE